MDVARLNFSHGTAEEHAETAQRVRDAAGRAGRQVAILQDLPGPKLRIGPLADGIAELKPGDHLTFVCGANGFEGDAQRMSITWAGLADSVHDDEIMYLADGAVRLRVTATRPGDGEIDAEVEIGGAVASRQGLNIPGEAAALPSRPRGGPQARADRREDRRRPRRALVRPPRRGHHVPAQAHAAAADRQDREAAGRPARGGDRARRRLRDGRARRPRHRDADRGGPDRAEAGDRAGRRARPPVDHRDADARLDGALVAPDARRGDRRRQRDPRRHRRGDALAGERGRPVPGRVGGDAGVDRRAHRADAAVPRVERAARAARPPRPRLHARLHRLPRRARAGPRRARRPDAERPLGAADLRAPADRADLRALARPRDRPPLRADVGRAGGVDAPLRGHRGADRGRRRRARSSSAG